MKALELKIERLGYEGHGVGYGKNGEIFFVRDTAPGDTVECEVPEGLKNYSEIVFTRLLSPSPDRIPPECEYFTRCGGCDWLHLTYTAQVRAKEKILAHTLSRAGVIPTTTHAMIAADQTFSYRNRAQFRTQAGRVGFYKKGTNDIVDILECKTANPAINQVLQSLRQNGGLVGSGNENKEKLEVTVTPDGKVTEAWNLPHGSGGFTQIHDGQNQKLQTLVKNLVDKYGGKKIVELFSGNGNLTFPYLQPAHSVLGMESGRSAVAEAQAEKKRREIQNVEFHQRTLNPFWQQYLPKGWSAETDMLVLDPPRQGSFGVLKNLNNFTNLRTIIYVSCSPLSFAQEASRYLAKWKLVELFPIDMFPQTRHIELVAVFQR